MVTSFLRQAVAVDRTTASRMASPGPWRPGHPAPPGIEMGRPAHGFKGAPLTGPPARPQPDAGLGGVGCVGGEGGVMIPCGPGLSRRSLVVAAAGSVALTACGRKDGAAKPKPPRGKP